MTSKPTFYNAAKLPKYSRKTVINKYTNFIFVLIFFFYYGHWSLGSVTMATVRMSQDEKEEEEEEDEGRGLVAVITRVVEISIFMASVGLVMASLRILCFGFSKDAMLSDVINLTAENGKRRWHTQIVASLVYSIIWRIFSRTESRGTHVRKVTSVIKNKETKQNKL